MAEKKTKTFIGNTGNRADIIEEDRNAQSEDARYGRELVAQAGDLFKPEGFELKGTATVFYYEKPTLTKLGQEFVYACQTDVSKVNENVADIGWKGLKNALMKAFGREQPKTRDS